MSEFSSKDGQYAYIRVEDGKWNKLSKADKKIVGELVVPHYGAHGSKPGSAYYGSKGSGAGYTELSKPVVKIKHAPEKESGWSSNWCGHDGKVLVWQQDGREFYAAGFGQIRPAEYALVLDLADQVNWKSRWTKDAIVPPAPKAYLALNQHVAVGKENVTQGPAYLAPPSYKNVIPFNWPDMGIIRTSREFWDSLWILLPKGKVLVSCMGSHGRTGTCMAALMMASGYANSALEAVLAVRSQHCERAIEHSNQLRYLTSLAKQWELDESDALQANSIPNGKSADALIALRAARAKAAKKG